IAAHQRLRKAGDGACHRKKGSAAPASAESGRDGRAGISWHGPPDRVEITPAIQESTRQESANKKLTPAISGAPSPATPASNRGASESAESKRSASAAR